MSPLYEGIRESLIREKVPPPPDKSPKRNQISQRQEISPTGIRNSPHFCRSDLKFQNIQAKLVLLREEKKK